jgi:hypothetical protein
MGYIKISIYGHIKTRSYLDQCDWNMNYPTMLSENLS